MTEKTQPFGRGETWYTGQTADADGGDDILGNLYWFRSYEVDGTIERPRTQGGRAPVCCMAVRNSAGIALAPKRLVVWKTGSRGTEVDGYCSSDAQEIAGVVDEYLPSGGVLANDIFFIVIGGPTLIAGSNANYATDIAAGDNLIAQTAATSQAASAGRLNKVGSTFTQAQTTNGYAINVGQNAFGKAMSAATTQQTGTDILAYVNVPSVGK